MLTLFWLQNYKIWESKTQGKLCSFERKAQPTVQLIEVLTITSPTGSFLRGNDECLSLGHC